MILHTMASGLVVNSVQDALAAASRILESEQREVVWLVPPSVHSLSMTRGLFEQMKAFVQKGGVSRGVVSISHANVEEIRMCVECGEDIRHSPGVHELFMYVGDTRESVSAINIGIEEYTFETPVTAFWSEDPTYAEYLFASFESAWSQAIPAAERIEELLAQGAER